MIPKRGEKVYRCAGFKTSLSTSSPLRRATFLIFLPLSLLLYAASPPHDYHVSVTQMQYNNSSKTFELSIRIFTDDLEKALGIAHGNKRFVVKNGDANDAFVSAYITKNLMLTNPQKRAVPIHYVGKEQEEDVTWIYVEIPFQLPLSGYFLQNSILTETFDDQVNMTNVTTPAGKKTYLYKKGQLVHVL
jgi:hypothetical protein